jgi:hypothetical protein
MYTFDDVSLSAKSCFVLTQWINCHGGVTNVVKTAGNVVKTVVKTRGGSRSAAVWRAASSLVASAAVTTLAKLRARRRGLFDFAGFADHGRVGDPNGTSPSPRFQ